MLKKKFKYSRVSQFHEIVPYLLQKHDNSHLEAKVYQTATRMTLKQNKSINDLALLGCLKYPHIQIVQQILKPGHLISMRKENKNREEIAHMRIPDREVFSNIHWNIDQNYNSNNQKI